MYTPNDDLITPDQVNKLTERWQRCRLEDIADLFYAYHETKGHTERVLSYRLSDKAFKALKDHLPCSNIPFSFIVRLGLRRNYREDEVANEPFFTLVLDVVPKDNSKGLLLDSDDRRCYRLRWQPDELLDPPGSGFGDNNSGPDEIPPQGAYLFLSSWLETSASDIASTFESLALNVGKRVKAYVYLPTESDDIAKKILATDATDGGGLFVHMGKGPAVSYHPFSFRPVLEVRKGLLGGPGGESPSVNLVDGPGGTYYDYSKPSPPYGEG